MSGAMWVSRHLLGCFVAAAAAFAESMPYGYFQGTMVRFEGTSAEGLLTARAADGAAVDCGYDSKSYIELSKQRITPAKLRAGDRLEILVDRSGRGRTCYIRTLHVLPQHVANPSRPTKAPRPPSRLLTPVATVTFSGIVLRKSNGSLEVRGRDREETLFLRRDTRFVGNGAPVDLADLNLNQRAFVEAGRNLDGALEAYQITWGEILIVR